MKFLDKILGRTQPPKPETVGQGELVVIVPIPPLVVMLHRLEINKGSDLTEAEVLKARDQAACITMSAADRDQLAELRGYRDVDLENVWLDWQEIREKMADGET